MAVKHEIKSQLAKLLATEDLIVEHRNVDTAQFEVRTRVLTLPKWEKASNNVYDSLVAHEVGHALFTPDIWDWIGKIPQQFVNVVEDVRIEKLMKRKYLGIAKTFYRGYNELHDKDFFEVNDTDITNLNLADRVNLHYKVGSFLPISFSDAETPIVRLIENAETFDDTISAAEALYNFCKEELENKQEEETELDSGMDLEGGGNIPNDTGDDSDTTVSESTGDASMEGGSGSNVDNSGMDAGNSAVEPEPEIETANTLEEALKNLIDNRNNLENVYIELPKLDMDKIIIPNEFIHNNCRQHYKEYEDETFFQVDSEFSKFKKSAQKEVNYLVKEFECKKSADAYARATISRTGVLDTRNLHTYKFNEDLFKKVSIIPDGKNHGLVFILDWSGSMSHVMLDTIKQLYNLLWFCKKVNIPFEVYAFTNEHPPVGDTFHRTSYEKKSGLALIEETFSLMNLFTSTVNNKILDEQMKNIFRVASQFEYSYTPRSFSTPIGMNLSGTPLNESIIALHQILPQFKKRNNLQKVQCIILTAG